MMVMKKLLLLLSVLLLQSAVRAEGYKYLTFETSGGEQQSIPTENLNITFADGTPDRRRQRTSLKKDFAVSLKMSNFATL